MKIWGVILLITLFTFFILVLVFLVSLVYFGNNTEGTTQNGQTRECINEINNTKWCSYVCAYYEGSYENCILKTIAMKNGDL